MMFNNFLYNIIVQQLLRSECNFTKNIKLQLMSTSRPLIMLTLCNYYKKKFNKVYLIKKNTQKIMIIYMLFDVLIILMYFLVALFFSDQFVVFRKVERNFFNFNPKLNNSNYSSYFQSKHCFQDECFKNMH